MSGSARRLIDHIHTLARSYHWRERDILALRLRRRAAYLAILDAEATGALTADVTGV